MAVAICAGWVVPVANAGKAPALCEGGMQQKCFVGDRLCANDAFDFAKGMLGSNHWDSQRSNGLLLVATGTMEQVDGLPELLEVEREVRATFAIDRLHRYQTEHDIPDWASVFWRFVGRPRVAYTGDGSARSREFGAGELRLDEDHPSSPKRFLREWMQSIEGVGPPKRIVIHLSSDLFVWPASGTARGVARMRGEEGEERGSDDALSGGRFGEGRGGALEVGGRYLFALGERVDGAQDEYRFTESAHAKWRVFWGDELEDVDRAMTAIVDCLAALGTLGEPSSEVSLWRICEDAARYVGAQYKPVVLRQRPVHATPCESGVRRTHQKCFGGDRLCVDDAFDLAKEMLDRNHWELRDDVLLVASGTIEDVQSLPSSLAVEREVRATFAIDWLYRYQTEHDVPDWKYFFDKSFAWASEAYSDGAAPVRALGARAYDLDGAHPFRPTRFVDEWVRGRMGNGPRKRIAIHLSSDLFLWPASGMARGVARMGSEERERHESAIRRTEALVAKLEAGELGDEEHRRLLWEDFEHRHLEGGRLVEDRGGALEVGGRYLFALGDIVDGAQDAYRFEERARTRWRVFWGDELEDVGRALSEIGKCLATLSIWPARQTKTLRPPQGASARTPLATAALDTGWSCASSPSA